jgi:hypothetical protein
VVRDQGDIVGENVKDVGRSSLNGEVRGVAFAWYRDLSSALVKDNLAYIDQSSMLTQRVKSPTL